VNQELINDKRPAATSVSMTPSRCPSQALGALWSSTGRLSITLSSRPESLAISAVRKVSRSKPRYLDSKRPFYATKEPCFFSAASLVVARAETGNCSTVAR
jgi:hypothetical protein